MLGGTDVGSQEIENAVSIDFEDMPAWWNFFNACMNGEYYVDALDMEPIVKLFPTGKFARARSSSSYAQTQSQALP